jgi:6-pyruvoyltetrahydropterin/6-carboxytetrahydropterin synthase
MGVNIIASRYHDFSCGHRVVDHESKCKFFHGHNYRVYFYIEPEIGLDNIGRVMDFSVIKEKLCNWLEDNFDHKMLLWENDPLLSKFQEMDKESIVVVPFNPTAENIAQYLVEVVGVAQLKDTKCRLIRCKVEETRKCSAEYKIN